MGIRGVRSRLSLKLHNEIKTKQNGLAWWSPSGSSKDGVVRSLTSDLGHLEAAFWVLERDGCFALAPGSLSEAGGQPFDDPRTRCVGFLPPLPIKHLGDPGFRADHRLRYAYVAGAMANGIASVELVEALGRAGMLGFFGAAGLDLTRIETAIERLQRSLAAESFGFNLIHSPNEPDREAATVSLYLRKGIRLVEAAAYLRLTLPVVRYRVTGIFRDAAGRASAPNRIVAKVSRVEVAAQFLSPPPEEMLSELVRSREITPEQAQLAADIPVAQDVTAEADSAGHTDNRPLVTLLPTLLSLRNRLQQKYAFALPLRIGAAGGLSTPGALAAAFAMGAAYVVTGSVNQACVESGASESVRLLLAQAEQADTAMAPAADMFEMGVKVQVLKRGTMFPMRATKLYELYRAYSGLEMLPANERATLEKQFFRTSLEAAWQHTRDYFVKRDPRQVERADRDAKHKMALVFRSYLGLSSRWANAGDPERVLDYQVWCGPAMGAFNEWTKDSWLEKVENRRVAEVGLNLLHGAAVQLRGLALRSQGIPLPVALTNCPPLEETELKTVLHRDE
jgi:trans-AT polyketide synthase, acyltransferase and oxidoreductase domains